MICLLCDTPCDIFVTESRTPGVKQEKNKSFFVKLYGCHEFVGGPKVEGRVDRELHC